VSESNDEIEDSVLAKLDCIAHSEGPFGRILTIDFYDGPLEGIALSRDESSIAHFRVSWIDYDLHIRILKAHWASVSAMYELFPEDSALLLWVRNQINEPASDWEYRSEISKLASIATSESYYLCRTYITDNVLEFR
jgi:hypothetical protein